MKIRRLATAFILATIPLLAQAPSTSSGPTLEETLDWLSNNIGAFTVNYGVHGTQLPYAEYEFYGSLSYEPLAMTSCNLKIRASVVNSVNSDSGGTKKHHDDNVSLIYSIPLGSLTSVTQGKPMVSSLIPSSGISFSNDRALYAVQFQSAVSVIRLDQTPGGTSTTDRLSLMSDKDPSFIARVQNAFSHAVDLCGKKEAF
jgi:hypothetical protein